jgi:glycosyltransferase involved in cell wall biosynthesis
MPPLVAYWSNIPSPYFVERFNALMDRPGIEFEVWFNDRTLPHRSWRVDEDAWRFPYRYVPRRRAAPLLPELSSVRDLLAERRPSLLVTLYAQPAFVVGWMQARRLRIKTAFRILAPSETWFPRRRHRELLKRYMFGRVDGLLVAGEDAADYVRSYGVEDSRIFDEPQVSDPRFFRTEAVRARERRGPLRAELGVSGIVFVYVGRLWWGKGVCDLLEAFAIARKQVPDATLLVVGDGDQADELRRRAQVVAPGGVVFAGFRQRPELPSILAASDVLMFPTLGDPYGLVVDEAMAAGLPVISTTAAGEIAARVYEGETGHLVPPGRPELMAERMVALARDGEARARMGARGAELMVDRTPQLWAERFEAAALAIVGRARR